MKINSLALVHTRSPRLQIRTLSELRSTSFRIRREKRRESIGGRGFHRWLLTERSHFSIHILTRFILELLLLISLLTSGIAEFIMTVAKNTAFRARERERGEVNGLDLCSNKNNTKDTDGLEGKEELLVSGFFAKDA